ncbi:MAG: double zinc ribbon domain-containing protein [Anaerolineales bacterium]
MSQHLLEKVSCPSCGSPIQLDQLTDKGEGAYIHCGACGSEFILRGHICPYCGAYHKQEMAFCRQCGQGLVRRCPKCQQDNWIGNEYCIQCGAVLDILALIVQRHNQGTVGHLNRQMASAQALKDAEEAASRARRARLMEKERQRQEQIRRDLAERKAQEQKMYTYFLIGVILFGVLIIITTILRNLGGDGAFPISGDVILF